MKAALWHDMTVLLSRWLGERPPVCAPTFFVTWRLRAPNQPLGPLERDLVCAVLRHGHHERYSLRAYVVMDDHVHVLVRITHVPVERLVHSWRSISTHELQRVFRRRGPVWQDGATTTPVQTDDALRSKMEYVIGNPWKRWPFLKRYPWVWEADDDGTPART
jgi:hypothetical protein